MDTAETIKRWGLKLNSSIHNRVKDFPSDTIRKFGKS